jgi:hypothetical protein
LAGPAYTPGSRFDAWLAAGARGGLRRNLAAWRLGRFRGSSERLYAALSDPDARRLVSGGSPWPTDEMRANPGRGLYLWQRRVVAERYLLARMETLAADNLWDPALGTQVRAFRIARRHLRQMRTRDLTRVTGPEFQKFIDEHTAYADFMRPHRFHGSLGRSRRVPHLGTRRIRGRLV